MNLVCTPRLTLPSNGGLANKDFQYRSAGTSLDLRQNMARYREMVQGGAALPVVLLKGAA